MFDETRELLIRYMARVVDVEGCSFIDDGMAYGFHPEFYGYELEELRNIEKEARQRLAEVRGEK